LITMSQEAYDIFLPILRKNGILLYDTDLVTQFRSHADFVVKAIPATRLAEEMGKKIVANIVMLGFATAQAGIASPEAMAESIRQSVPKKFIDLNIKAFETGFQYTEK